VGIYWSPSTYLSFYCTKDLQWMNNSHKLWFIYLFLSWMTFGNGLHCRNPSLGLATKVKGLQGCGPRQSPWVAFSCLWECKRMWGKEPSHSQVNSHVGSWSPGGLPNVQRAITRVKTQWLEKIFILLEIYWNLNV